MLPEDGSTGSDDIGRGVKTGKSKSGKESTRLPVYRHQFSRMVIIK